MPPGNVTANTPVIPVVDGDPNFRATVPEIVRHAPTMGGKLNPAVRQRGKGTAEALRNELTKANGRTRAEAPRAPAGKDSSGQGNSGGTPAAISDGKHPFLDLVGKAGDVFVKTQEVAIAWMNKLSELWGLVTEAITATAKRAAESAKSWFGM